MSNFPYANYTSNDPNYAQVQLSLTSARGKGKGPSTSSKRTKSGKSTASSTASPRTSVQDVTAASTVGTSSSTPPTLHWPAPPAPIGTQSTPADTPATPNSRTPDPTQQSQQTAPLTQHPTILVLPGANEGGSSTLNSKASVDVNARNSAVPPGAADEEGEGDDDLLPAMADDDYSALLSFQTQSKDNLKVLMDNFTAEQYDRYEAYRRNALPKQAVRRVIQQTLGQQISMPVAQIVAGFGKVFVGEIVEKARQVQRQRGERGPLAPDHLREAYMMYQEETGRVGAARPLRGKRPFIR